MGQHSGSDLYIFGIPVTPWNAIMSACFLLILIRLRKLALAENDNGNPKDKEMPTADQTLKLITSRRTILPKDYNGDKLTHNELQSILEAANWAPTHQKCEPWRYTILQGDKSISEYLDFIEAYYTNNWLDTIEEKEAVNFKNKLADARKSWMNASHALLIGMKRQALKDVRLPEWEEICALACSVQNMHLMSTGLENVGAFWSSHTWCKRARDSKEIKSEYFAHLLDNDEDRVFGAFLLGKYDSSKKFRSTRSNLARKIHYF